MIIQCDKCNTRFRLDDSKVGAGGVKVRCTKCQNVFIVTPPEEIKVEELVPAQEKKTRAAATRERPEDRANLKFDFERPPEFQSDPAPAPPAERPLPEETRTEPKAAPTAEAKSQADRPSEDEKEAPKNDWEFTKEVTSQGPGNDGHAFEITPPVERKPQAEVDFDFDDNAPAPGLDGDKGRAEFGEALAQAHETRSSDPTGAAERPHKDFSEVLAGATGEGTVQSEEAVTRETGARGFRINPGFFVAAAIIIMGVAVYFSGIIDTVARRISPPAPVAVKTVEIEALTGSYIENKNFGKVFVLQAKIKNITDKPQAIKAVTGVLYSASGEKLASRSVSPGRVVSLDDVKALQKDDLAKSFKDPSGGRIPAKGTVPVMILFTEVPQGLSEYGLDIVR